MKKILNIIIAVLLLFCFAACSSRDASNASGSSKKKNPFICIITGSVSQSEDERRGAEKFREMYGEENVRLVVYPDNFTEEKESVVQAIINMSNIPGMKALIVNQAVPGTAEAFTTVKRNHPEILCIASEPHENVEEISKVADLVCACDFVSRGYLMIKTAHDLGLDTFVHISFPRHMAYENMQRRVSIMQEACKEFNINFVMETAPDTASDIGVAGSQAFIINHAPEWIEKYGTNAAYFCTNDAHTEPLIKQLLEYGGYFIEADLPSPLMGYPGALGIDFKAEGGDFDKILERLEMEINSKNGSGRFGTWTYGFSYTQSAGLAQHALNVINGESELCNMEDIAKAYKVFTPKASWNGSNYTSADAKEKLSNVFLVYQDTYMMGNPGKYMHTTEVKVPVKYFSIY